MTDDDPDWDGSIQHDSDADPDMLGVNNVEKSSADHHVLGICFLLKQIIYVGIIIATIIIIHRSY